MKMQKMLSGLAIVASMLIAGAAMASNTVPGYGLNGGTNLIGEVGSGEGSGSTVGVTLAIEKVSAIKVSGSLDLDITPYTITSSLDSSPIDLKYDSNFAETFTIALTSTGNFTLPGTWTISSSGADAVLTSASTDTLTTLGQIANASFSPISAGVTWGSAPHTNIGLTVTAIDLNSLAETKASDNYAGTLTFTTTNGL